MDGVWIRSQSGETLGYMKRVRYIPFMTLCEGANFIVGVDSTDPTHLGEYATKERAKEIIDDIQKHIFNGVHEVYQMPEE